MELQFVVWKSCEVTHTPTSGVEMVLIYILYCGVIDDINMQIYSPTTTYYIIICVHSVKIRDIANTIRLLISSKS